MAADLKLSPSAERLPNPEAAEAGTSLWKDAWHRLRRNRMATASLVFFLFVTAAFYLGPFLHPYAPNETNLTLVGVAPFEKLVEVDEPTRDGTGREVRFTTLARLSDASAIPPERVRVGRRTRPITEDERGAILQAFADGRTHTVEGSVFAPSSRAHVLGTDHLGRDLLARILAGGRVSLGVGFLATFVSVVIGVLYGSVAAYQGGKTDAVMMRIVDILYALPFTIFVILLMVIFGRSILLMFIAIGAVEWLTMARIVRAQVLNLKRMEFVEAARALGLGNRRIVLRHIIPNALGPVIVFSTLTVPAVMLLEAALSFLGLGVQPPAASLGVLIKDGADTMQTYPWTLLFPALVFSMTLFALNFLGDGLRDALDVRASRD